MSSLTKRIGQWVRTLNSGALHRKRAVVLASLLCAALLLAVELSGQPGPFGGLFSFIPNGTLYPNPLGASQTINVNGGGLDVANPFFQSLGTNGRACITCHQPSDGMAVSAAHVELRFLTSQGTDPIFRPVDGTVCDHGVDLTTVAGRAEAYRLLRTRGLFRITIPVPANADYRVVSVENPYGCNDTANIAAYRRPLPATNLRFLTSVMIDGRESTPVTGTQAILYDNSPGSLLADLKQQAFDATMGHAQAAVPPSDDVVTRIANFELGLATAQVFDRQAGLLSAGGAQGGPQALVSQPFFVSMNSSINPLFPQLEQPGGLVTPGDGQFTSAVFNIFQAWANRPPQDPRAAIARGEAIFNSKPIHITGVAGLNDPAAQGGLAPGGLASINGTCGTCHDTVNVGNHSFPTPLDIGTGDPDPANPSLNLGGLDIAYLPRVTVCKLDPATGATTADCKTTADLGQALIDGNFDHVGKVKGPVLRGLAARAPYFHNGSARTLLDVVRFYEKRFGWTLTPQEESDLVAFLGSL